MRLVIPVLIVSNGKGMAWGVGDARIEKGPENCTHTEGDTDEQAETGA
jgi:hypothetical protein